MLKCYKVLGEYWKCCICP